MFDRLIEAVSPNWGLRRKQARVALGQISALYDGARNSRRTRGWRADGAGPNAELGNDLPTLRARSRDLVRNNPFASAAIDILASYQIGTGIVPRSATGDDGLDKQVDALFAEWSGQCDAARMLDFGGLQAQAARSRAEAGEALLMTVTPSTAEMRRRDLRVPLLLQSMEPDHLDDTLRGTPKGSANRVEQGVEVDAMGAPAGYWLLSGHPGETILSRDTSTRVDASRLMHIYQPLRPGQMRGVPTLASVITRLRGLDELEDAALDQAKIQACLAAFVTTGAGPNAGPLAGTPDADTGQRVKTFSPGMIERLGLGEDVKFNQPSGGGTFSETARHQLHAIAQGAGLTYDLLTGDLSQANYSSLRAGRLAFRRRIEAAQWLMFIPRMCDPVWRAFIAAAQMVGLLPPRAGGYPVEWGAPHFEMVDPLKDALAIKQMQRMGLLSWGQSVSEMGWAPNRQIEEIRKWNQALDEAGIVLDSDPRRVTDAGGAQNAKQLAAVELAARET